MTTRKKKQYLHIAKLLSASEIRKGLKISKKDLETAMRAIEMTEKKGPGRKKGGEQ